MATQKTPEAPTTETQKPEVDSAHKSDAPKVRTRRLSTSLRAGLSAGDEVPPPDGGGGDPVDGGDGTSGGTGKTMGGDGCFITYGSVGTWGCR